MSQTKAQLIEGSSSQTITASSATIGAGSAGSPSITTTGDTNTGILFPAADTVAISTSGTERARLDSSGRLLVGTSLTAGNTDAQTALIQTIGNSGGSFQGGRINLGRAEYSANITAGEQLGGIYFSDAQSGTYGVIECVADGTGGTNDFPGRLTFSTTADGASSPTERARLNSAGKWLIGATTSINDAHTFVNNVNNSTVVISNTVSSGTLYGLQIRYANQDPNGTGSSYLECYSASSNTLRAEIRSNGGLANYSANNVNLSDINSKKDISPAANTWNCLKQWEIVNFRYKDQPDDADLNMGVIAQQVAESCPEVIQIFQEAREATDTEPAKEERLGVKDQQMMWMAIKALQEAQLRIETLEAEVAALKGV